MGHRVASGLTSQPAASDSQWEEENSRQRSVILYPILALHVRGANSHGTWRQANEWVVDSFDHVMSQPVIPLALMP